MDRENLFNLDLGNLQPRDLVRIRFAYVQEVNCLDDLRMLRIPLTPSVRYIPGRVLPRANQGTGTVDDTDQVPDASRLSPPRIDGLHPDAAHFHARVKIDAPHAELANLLSPSHAIEIKDGEEETVIDLRGNEEAPSRDFVIGWATKPCQKVDARGWVTEHRGRPYACLRLDGGQFPKKTP